MENGEWRMEKGEGRREKGEGRREIIKDGKVCVHQVTPRHIMPVSHLERTMKTLKKTEVDKIKEE